MTRKADLAVIFAGGHGTRLVRIGEDRRDKGAIELAGKPLFAHVVDRLAPQAERLAIVAPERPDWFDALPPGTLHLRDEAGPDGRPAGPAGALQTALAYGHDLGPGTRVLTAPVDSPFLPSDLYERLAAAQEAAGTPAALAATRGRLHPVFGLWQADLAADMHKLVHQERVRALHLLAGPLGAIEVMAWDDVTLPPPFFNINTEEDVTIAQDLAHLIG